MRTRNHGIDVQYHLFEACMTQVFKYRCIYYDYRLNKITVSCKSWIYDFLCKIFSLIWPVFGVYTVISHPSHVFSKNIINSKKVNEMTTIIIFSTFNFNNISQALIARTRWENFDSYTWTLQHWYNMQHCYDTQHLYDTYYWYNAHNWCIK